MRRLTDRDLTLRNDGFIRGRFHGPAHLIIRVWRDRAAYACKLASVALNPLPFQEKIKGPRSSLLWSERGLRLGGVILRARPEVVIPIVCTNLRAACLL